MLGFLKLLLPIDNEDPNEAEEFGEFEVPEDADTLISDEEIFGGE